MARKILIVTGNEVERKALTEFFSEGFDVVTAESESDALPILRRNSISVSAVVVDITPPFSDNVSLIKRIRTNAIWAQVPIAAIIEDNPETKERIFAIGANCYFTRPFRRFTMLSQLKNIIRLCESSRILNTLQMDKLTGIYNREAFIKEASVMIKQSAVGHYVLSCIDIENFKVINDNYGTEKGDAVLRHVADTIKKCVKKWNGICCRFMADKFAVLYPTDYMDSQENIETHRIMSMPPCLGERTIKLRIGRYVVDDVTLPVSTMYDRASLAEGSIKGKYDFYIAEYDEEMRAELLHEQKIINEMHDALDGEQFEVWFQPQYNHVSKKRIGAEALVRWRHPERGLVPPIEFIPIFERNGFIYELDKYVWETVCKHLRKWIDDGKNPQSVSVNVSRHDMYQPDFYDFITGLIKKYRLPVDILRLEVTESAFSVSSEQIIDVVRALRIYGFIVEIDDFGSGYSSLNILKDVPANVLKLDMRFLSGANTSQRGGRILESIIRMAKWLNMPVIAEGVETKEQADYLCALGCERLQGYYYARPMPVKEYESLPSEKTRDELNELRTIKYLGGDSFWNPNSIETMVFSHFSGGACIFEMRDGRAEMLRVNGEFPRTFRTDMTEGEILRLEPFSTLTGESKATFVCTINKAIESGKPEEFEMLSTLYSSPGEYVHFTLRLVASSDDRYLFYGYVENITAQRNAERKVKALATQMQSVIDNIYSGVYAVTVCGGERRIILANDLFYEQLGYTRDEYEKEVKSFYDLIYPSDRETVRDIMKDVMATGTPTTIVYRVRRKDGIIRWMESHVSIVSFPDMEEVVQLLASNDITSQQETSEHLRFLNDMAHELLEQPDTEKGINGTLRKLMNYFKGKRAYIFESNDEEGTSSNTYEVCAEGVSEEKDNLQKVPIEMMSFWYRAFDEQGYLAVENVDELDNSRAEEREILSAQGIKSLVAIPLKRNGEIFGFFGIDDGKSKRVLVDELTALGDYISVMLIRRNMTEKILKDSENVLMMMNDSPGGFNRLRVMPDKTLVGVYANKEFSRMMGMTQDEVDDMYQSNAWWGIHPDDLSNLSTGFAEMTKDFQTKEVRFRLRDNKGEYIPLHAYGRAIKDELGDMYLNLFYADLTEEEKRTERQRDLMDNLPCGAGICETDGKTARMLYLNKKYYSYFSCEVAKRSAESAFIAVHPDDLALLMRTMDTVRLGVTEGGCVIRIADGDKYITFRLFGSTTGVKDGKASIYVTFTPIINERLTFSEMLPITLSEVVSASNNMMFLKDKNFRYVLCNKPFAKANGYDSEADIIGKTDFELVNGHDARIYRREDEIVVSEKRALIDNEILHTAADGTAAYSNTSRYPLLDSNGNIIGIFGITRDITESKENDAKLKLMANCIPGGLATYVCTSGDLSAEHIKITYFNDGFCKLFGYTREEYEKISAKDPTSLIFVEDRVVLERQLMALIQKNKPIDCIYRVHVGNGYKWINHRAEASVRDGESVTVNAVLTDVTERHTEMERLRISEEENRLAILHSGTVISHFDVKTRTMTLATEVAARFGMPPVLHDVPNGPVRDGLVSAETKKTFIDFFERIIAGEKEGSTTFQFFISNRWRWQRAHFSTVTTDNGEPLFAVISLFDVSDQLEKEAVYIKWKQSLRERDAESYSLYRCNISKTSAFESVGGTLLKISPDTMKRSYAGVTKAYAKEFVHEDDKDEYIELLEQESLLSDYYRGKRLLTLEYRERLVGGIRWLRLTVELLEYPNSDEVEAYLMYEDIDEIKRSALRIQELANVDFLTGLLNRKAFIEKMNEKISGNANHSLSALFMLDLDGFKAVNDCFGHVVGDNTLVEMAGKLRSIFRKTDLVCRLGGDEFLAFLHDVSNVGVVVEKAKQICMTMRKSFSVEVQTSASVGVVMIPTDGEEFDTLYHKADIALYHVKTSGKNNYAFYNDNQATEAPHLFPHPNLNHDEPKRRMLIVEDNENSRELLVNMFRDKFIIDTAEDGESALKRLTRYGYSLSVVLLDLIMPNMDGFDVLQRMRENSALSTIPVVVVSGLDEREASLKAIKCGASDFVLKPVDPDLLYLRVESAIAKAENEKLRAYNSYLAIQSAEVQRLRAAMDTLGTVLATYDEDGDVFEYDDTFRLYLAGRYDDRPIWDIFLEDKVAEEEDVERLKALMKSLKKDKSQFSGSLVMRLRTPRGKIVKFLLTIIPFEGVGTDCRRLLVLSVAR